MTFEGYEITVSPDLPKYVLPEEVCPGVPWPPGFREEINAWSRQTLGTTCLIPDGESWIFGDREIIMNSRTYKRLASELQALQKEVGDQNPRHSNRGFL